MKQRNSVSLDYGRAKSPQMPVFTSFHLSLYVIVCVKNELRVTLSLLSLQCFQRPVFATEIATQNSAVAL